jgi:hypothetical protein
MKGMEIMMAPLVFSYIYYQNKAMCQQILSEVMFYD